MKYIFILMSIGISLLCSAQDTNIKQDTYFYIKSDNFFGSRGSYRAKFTFKSKDSRFSTDNYFLRIINPLGEEKLLFSLGQKIDLNNINYIIPKEFFKNKSACETHNELSLMNKGRLFVITDIHPELLIREKDKTKKYMLWEVKYDGTVKNYAYSNLGRGPFFEKI